MVTGAWKVQPVDLNVASQQPKLLLVNGVKIAASQPSLIGNEGLQEVDPFCLTKPSSIYEESQVGQWPGSEPQPTSKRENEEPVWYQWEYDAPGAGNHVDNGRISSLDMQPGEKVVQGGARKKLSKPSPLNHKAKPRQ